MATVDGSSASETLNGTSSADSVNGYAGNDVLNGLAGNDRLDGGTGNDTLNGGDGNDSYIFTELTGGDELISDAGGASDVITYIPSEETTETEVFRSGANNENLTVQTLQNSIVKQTILISNQYGSGAAPSTAIEFLDIEEDGFRLTIVNGFAGSTLDDLLVGTTTADTITGGAGIDIIYAASGNDTVDGGADEDEIYAGGGNDSLSGGSGNDYISGGVGNDTLVGGSGDDELSGGSGTDTAVFGGASRAFGTKLAGGVFEVRGTTASYGTDSLDLVENIRFSDVSLETLWFSKTILLMSAQRTSLTELYIASFNRAPDAIGLSYWGGRLYDGMTLSDIAKSFFVQPETVAAYPSSMPTQTFVTTVYNNVLSRAPDTDGLNYWVREIDTGSVSKDTFLLAIINGAKASTGSAVDRQTLANKVTVGDYFALEKGLNSTVWGIDVMDSVTSSTSTTTAANALTDSYSAAIATGTSSSSAMLIGVSDIWVDDQVLGLT